MRLLNGQVATAVKDAFVATTIACEHPWIFLFELVNCIERAYSKTAEWTQRRILAYSGRDGTGGNTARSGPSGD